MQRLLIVFLAMLSADGKTIKNTNVKRDEAMYAYFLKPLFTHKKS